MVSLMLLPYMPRTPLFGLQDRIQTAVARKLPVEDLRIGQLARAQDASLAAFESHAFYQAITIQWLPTFLWRPLTLFLWTLYLIDPAKRCRQIAGGRAVCFSVLPQSALPPPTMWQSFCTYLSKRFISLVNRLAGAEIQRRIMIIGARLHTATNEALEGLGVKHEDTVLVQVLGVSPTLQGTGCGSRLVQDICDWADEKGLVTHLFAVADDLVPFYNRRGFRVGSYVDFPCLNPSIGLEDRKLRLPVMVRAPGGR